MQSFLVFLFPVWVLVRRVFPDCSVSIRVHKRPGAFPRVRAVSEKDSNSCYLSLLCTEQLSFHQFFIWDFPRIAWVWLPQHPHLKGPVLTKFPGSGMLSLVASLWHSVFSRTVNDCLPCSCCRLIRFWVSVYQRVPYILIPNQIGHKRHSFPLTFWIFFLVLPNAGHMIPNLRVNQPQKVTTL